MNLQGENESVKLELLISYEKVPEATHAVPGVDSTVLPPQIARHMEGVQVMIMRTSYVFSCCQVGFDKTLYEVSFQDSKDIS